ncbi:MAG: hypothetical protein ACI8RZ_007454 [Myxococcota bacterium]|jgi:hypothetical protein
MALMSTKEHLKYVKGRASQLKSTDGKEMAFCLLRRKGSKDVLVHFDKVSQVAKYKNPTMIHRILKKTAAFKFAEARSFFEDVTKLESMTGLVKNHGDDGLVFLKTQGRAAEGALSLGLKLLKIKDFTFEASATAALADEPPSEALLTRLKGMAPTLTVATDITADPGSVFGSMSEMIEALEALRDTTDPVLKALRRTLSRAYQRLSDWDDGGIEPVSDALAALTGDDDFTEELADLESAEALALEEVMAELQDIRDESAALLSRKELGGHIKSLYDAGRLLKNLKEGHFRLASNTLDELGGQPAMLVSSSASFDAEKLTMLKESTRTELLSGMFQKSKSGKKIAIVSSSLGVSRTLFKTLFASLGMALDPYIVSDFENLQTQLQGLKEAAEREDLVARIATTSSVKELKLQTCLDTPELLDAITRFAIEDFTVDSIGFLIAARSLTPPTSLPDALRVSGSQAIYETYIDPGAPQSVNVHFTVRDPLGEMAEKAEYGKMDFSAAAAGVAIMFSRDAHQRFIVHPILHEAISDSPTLLTLFGID